MFASLSCFVLPLAACSWLDDFDGLHKLISEALFKFISEKGKAFPNATISQTDFWSIPAFKRAMVWFFFCCDSVTHNASANSIAIV